MALLERQHLGYYNFLVQHIMFLYEHSMRMYVQAIARCTVKASSVFLLCIRESVEMG